MRKLKKILLGVLAGLLLIILVLVIYLNVVARISPPEVVDQSALSLRRENKDSTFFTIGNNWLHKSENGLFEVYVEGDAFERGVVLGKLTEELVKKQERIFNQQIERLVPSSLYRKFLMYFIGWFNRDLDKHVPLENKLEIYGVSQSASHDYDYIASPYQRLLNYHAAHDIGHALQNMSLVGCTSFATWNSSSADSTLIIGRNFDFFVGEDFAQDKIIAFYNPSSGHKFMMVTWGGMTGVLSGMNEHGLTVTLNAAKSEIPSAAATPVSIVAREILQYASTIEEAYAIAKKRKTFVAESFLIGSAKDKRAVVIEKSPESIALYETKNDWLIDTNHFMSESLGNTPLNEEHKKTSASPYRYDRVKELLQDKRMNVETVVSILRDKAGIHNENIGLGNEKAINQLIAHHSIIFEPEKKLVWISTTDWGLGKFVAYDLNKIFSMKKTDGSEVYESARTISQDDFTSSRAFRNYEKYFQYRFPFQIHAPIVPDSVVKWNPDLYHSYMVAGEESCNENDYGKALTLFTTALTKEIATTQERDYIVKRIEYCKSKIQ
jgi:hypothetical protein